MSKLTSLLIYTTAIAAAAVQVRDSSCTPGTVISNGRLCTVVCGTDYPGGDVASQYTGNFQSCINACTARSDCATAQYSISSGYCYIKNNVDANSTNADINSVVCQAPDTCIPGPTIVNGRSGNIECGSDHPGGDYQALPASTLQNCENDCAADPKCLTAQYDPRSRYCYLKSTITTSVANPNIDSIVFATPLPAPVAGCMPVAPASPGIYNGGFEQGVIPWQLLGQGQSGNLTSGVALEGCKAFVVTPTSDPTKLRFADAIFSYSGLSPGRTYSISLKVGSPYSSLQSGTGPYILVLIGGNYVIQQTNVCGWTASGGCPITGTGGAQGQILKGSFQAQNVASSIYVYMWWPANVANSPVLLDDLELALV